MCHVAITVQPGEAGIQLLLKSQNVWQNQSFSGSVRKYLSSDKKLFGKNNILAPKTITKCRETIKI